MGGTTAGGLPYPVGTEPVRDGDNAIKALADAVEARGGGLLVQRENFVATPDGAGQFSHFFPLAFAAGSTPTVQLTCGSAAAGTVIVAGIIAVDAAGFTAALTATVAGQPVQGRSSPTWVYMIAMGPK